MHQVRSSIRRIQSRLATPDEKQARKMSQVSEIAYKNYESLNRTPRRRVLTMYYLPTPASFSPFSLALALALAFAVDDAGAVDSGSFNSS